ncbi:GIY-YIG nuclease family protein, partial [Desulfobacterales bacterium HSG17]|nr:GIY-YIG nuclease family protein [Desulfobacterales bacterium HSG17]
MADNIRNKLGETTNQPGVYLMYSAGDEIIYVGKAAKLKTRLSSYFRHQKDRDPKTTALINSISRLETIVTATEKEALILEADLIKRHRPRYNINLKDDKRYPSLRIDLHSKYPNLQIVRKVKKDGALYFGPYTSSHAVRQTLKLIDRTFKLRKCNDREVGKRKRPCLNCQMQGCLAPCCN